MGIEISAFSGRTIDFNGQLFQSGGVTGLVLHPADKVRVKIGVTGAVPLLDLVSGTPTPNGSSVTITGVGQAANPPNVPLNVPATYTLHLAQGDLATLNPGDYDLEVNVVDSTDTAPPFSEKVAESHGVFHLIGQQLGNVG